MQKEFEDAVFEFVKRISNFDIVNSVILFGSVAKGEADKRSDIDFLIIFDTIKPIRRIKEKKEIGNITLDIEKRFDRNIQLVFSNKNFERLDRQFVEQAFKEGLVLYGRVPQIDVKKLRLEPYSLVYFSLKKLSKSDKMKFKKAIYGHKTIKKYKNKVYKSSVVGIVEQLGGRRTGIASVLIPAKKIKEFTDILKKFGAEYEILDVWISQP